MKEKILYLVIGILVGAIISTGVFMVLNKTNQNNMSQGGREGRPNIDMNNIPEGMENMIMERPNGQGGPNGRGTQAANSTAE